jgi:hypothetical protein
MQPHPHKRPTRAPQELDLRDVEIEDAKTEKVVGTAGKSGKPRKKTAGKDPVAPAQAAAAAAAAAAPPATAAATV